MHAISIRECVSYGWEILKKRPLVVIGAMVLTMLINGIISSVFTPAEGTPFSLTVLVMGLVSGAIGILTELGLVTFTLRAHDAVERVQLKDLWNPKPFVYYLAGQIVVGFIVVIGIILLIVPGVIAALGLMFTSYLIVDKGRGPLEALKESWHLTKGHKLTLFLLVLALTGLNILGLLALVVGLLVTIPVSMLALVHAYRTLEKNTSHASQGASVHSSALSGEQHS